jgi:hypothetical protein
MTSTKKAKYNTPLLTRGAALTKPPRALFAQLKIHLVEPGPPGDFAKGGSIYLKGL